MASVDARGNEFGGSGEIAARCAVAAREVDLLAGGGGGHRASARFGEVVAVDLGVPRPWAVRVGCWTPHVSADDVAAGLDWARRRSRGHGFRLTAPAEHGPWDGLHLVVRDRLPAFALPAGAVATIGRPPPPELELAAPTGLDELVDAYGGWMDDHELARGLIVEDDLRNPRRGSVVARVEGRPVGCALVWWAAGTAYVSGVGVVPGLRGRGYGAALTVAAARLGAAGPPAGPATDLVWMYGTAQGAALYGALGFRPAGEEVQLGPPDGP